MLLGFCHLEVVLVGAPLHTQIGIGVRTNTQRLGLVREPDLQIRQGDDRLLDAVFQLQDLLAG